MKSLPVSDFVNFYGPFSPRNFSETNANRKPKTGIVD